MPNERITIDLSSLRVNPPNKFIVRFSDISEECKRMLAVRIKQTAPIWKIKRDSGPTTEMLQKALADINPIVFCENIASTYINAQQHQNFNIFNVQGTFGYFYRRLCGEIYHLICLRRPLTRKELIGMGYLTCGNWRRAEELVERHYTGTSPMEPIQSIPRIEEFGIADLARLRAIRISNDGENPIPEGMRDRTPDPEFAGSISRQANEIYRTGDIPGFSNLNSYNN